MMVVFTTGLSKAKISNHSISTVEVEMAEVVEDGQALVIDARPDRIYKYRSFSDRTLEMLVRDKLYYADPSKFNDPLDTRPTLKADVDVVALEEILRTLVERRITAEMKAAAEVLHAQGPGAVEHILKLVRKQTDWFLEETVYDATNPEYETDQTIFFLSNAIKGELLRQYDKGIVSLSERWESAPMWSHYGDQHRGFCIGYSIPSDIADSSVRKVNYGGDRQVTASDVAAMLQGDVGKQQSVDDLVLLQKAEDWRYEREWRLIGTRDLQGSPLEMEEVIFGMKCDSIVEYVIAKALEDRPQKAPETPVKFYKMHAVAGIFDLSRRNWNDDGLQTSRGPRRARGISEYFDVIPAVMATLR